MVIEMMKNKGQRSGLNIVIEWTAELGHQATEGEYGC